MAYDLSQQFVVGISSSALFDLKEEDRIFREEGLQAFIDYQRKREEVNLSPGSAFPLIKGLLNLNTDLERPKVEVILMSRNHPDVCLRVFISIDHHGLAISRASLTEGECESRASCWTFRTASAISRRESKVRPEKVTGPRCAHYRSEFSGARKSD